jgi:hypothetical protein
MAERFGVSDKEIDLIIGETILLHAAQIQRTDANIFRNNGNGYG